MTRTALAALLLAGFALVSATQSSAWDRSAGDLHLQSGGYVEGLGVIGTDGGESQRPAVLAHLRLDASHPTGVRGHLEVRGRAGGPFEGAHAGPYDFVHTFQNHSPSVELVEGWADVSRGRAQLRLGVQRFAWGVLDGLPPTDVLNPRDYHDPLVLDFEENKIGVPAAQLTISPPDASRLGLTDLRLDLVFIPLAVPSRLPLQDERWFPQSARPPTPFTFTRAEVQATVERQLKLNAVSVCDGLRVPVQFATANRRTPVELDNGGYAMRLGGTFGRSSWHLYHYSGPETAPNGDLQVRNRATARILTCDGPQPRIPGLVLRATAFAELRQANDEIHMTGVDWARPISEVTVRAEVAHFLNRPTLRIARDLVSEPQLAQLVSRKEVACLRNSIGLKGESARTCSGPVRVDDLFVDRDVVEWGAGVDWLRSGVFVLGQLNQIIGTESTPRLIVSNPETRVTGLIRRHFLQDTVEVEIRGVYSLERGGWFALPRVSYALTDQLRLRVGYLAIGGSKNSVFGQFGRNDEVVLQLRYAF